jgi:TnpA family transposase
MLPCSTLPKALCGLGKALKTVFLRDYLPLESLRREISRGLTGHRYLEWRQRFHPVRKGLRVREL